MEDLLQIKWKFFIRTATAIPLITPWDEITHEHAQSVLYENGYYKATPAVKCMMKREYIYVTFRGREYELRMEEYLNV